MEPPSCATCHYPLSESFYFCPNCGKKIKEHFSSSIWKQVGIYSLSFFLPPLGLYPGIKYAMQKEQKIRNIGLVAIALTIISIGISIWVSIALFGSVNKTLNSQLNQYQNLGY